MHSHGKLLFAVLLLLGISSPVWAELAESTDQSADPAVNISNGPVRVYRVPITEAISKPNLYILRRSIKQAISGGVDVIVLDMDTPGGRVDITLDMMELLDRFEGDTITYINDERESLTSIV